MTYHERRDAALADRRSVVMIYQAQLKRQVAEHYGIAFDKLDHLVYGRWARLRDRFLRNT